MPRSGGRLALRALLAVLMLAGGSGGASAAAGSAAAALADPVRRARALARGFGLHVVAVEGGEEILAVGADRPLVVASNTKLLTSAAALELLGPGYFFETALLMRGTLRGDALVGDLAIRGGGDPNFSGRLHQGDAFAVFRGWARRLRELGVRRITGDVLLHHGAWEDERVHPDWPRDQRSRCYEAPVDALSFNDNCLGVVVRPGPAPGRPAEVSIDPELDLFTVRNEAVTTSSARRHLIAVDPVPGTHEVVVSGRVYRRARPLETRVAVDDPAAYFGAALVAAFADEGVELGGRPRPVTELAGGPWWRYQVHRTDLLTTLEVVNTESQNFYAESVLKTLGHELCGAGSWEAGRRRVVEFAHSIGLAAGAFELADGSGMSRGNRFSARQLTRLLRRMASHELAREFQGTLPASGSALHPRWRQRLAREPYRGRVLAKTGSLSGVSALSGYARALSGRLYAFSILFNGVRSVYDARRAQDRILRVLIDHG